MSENVNSKGFMAVLTTPITSNEDQEEISEQLYDLGFYLNYEGTMVYNIISQDEYGWYGLNIEGEKNLSNKVDKNKFIKDCKKYGLDIDTKTVRFYSCTWYNGADSDMSMLNVEDYKKRIR